MKLKTDPRHIKRTQLMQLLFSWNFLRSPDRKLRLQKKPAKQIFKIVKQLPQIDAAIADCAKDRPISEINRIDLAILRLAIFELIIESKTPPKVVIDEAVELGKEFGSDSSGPFINGTLGQLIKIKKIKI